MRNKEEFIRRLGCDANTPLKVLSIFGNTGDGKSHTLNHTLFDGAEVFKTSHLQSSCTAGVWAAYDRQHRAVVLDTEGLQGVSANENRRTRLLLKVLMLECFMMFGDFDKRAMLFLSVYSCLSVCHSLANKHVH